MKLRLKTKIKSSKIDEIREKRESQLQAFLTTKFKKIVEDHLENKANIYKSTTLVNERYKLAHIKYLFSYEIHEFDVNLIKRYFEYLKRKKISNDRIHKIWKTTERIYLHFCKIHGITLPNPFLAIETKLEKKSIAQKFYTLDEFEKFISYFAPDIFIKTFFITLFLTGMRKGEALALFWTDINLDEQTISINKSFSSISPKNKTLDELIISTKTSKSDRVIHIPDLLIKFLHEFKNHQKLCPHFSENELVFSIRKKPRSFHFYQMHYKNAIKAVNLKNITIHGLRHSFATLAINNNMNLLSLSTHLGHSSPNQTLKVYAHHYKQNDTSAKDILNGILKKDLFTQNKLKKQIILK